MMTTNLEQGRGYVQILMQEGKLEEEIVNETSSIYQLKKETVLELIHEYKTTKTEQYKRNISANLKQRFLLLLFPLLAGTFYLFTARQIKPFGFIFWPIIILCGFTILGLIYYCVSLIGERYSIHRKIPSESLFNNPDSPSEKNKRVIFLFFILTSCFSLSLNYKYFTKSYLINAADLAKTTSLILNEDCIRKHIKGRGGYWFFSVDVTQSYQSFRWKSSDHEYAFKEGYRPDEILKQGDTVSLYLDKNDILSNAKTIFFYDIEKQGIHLLDLPERNIRAKKSAFKDLIFAYGLALLFLLTFCRAVYLGRRKTENT